MKTVDTHTHAWGADTAELPWSAAVLPPGWDGPYTHADLVADMDRASVDEAVVVTTPLYGRGPRANEYTMRAIEAHPDRLWGVGLCEYFGDAETVRESVRRVLGNERMLGLRFHACLAYAEHPTELDRHAEWILDDDLEPAWEVAAATDSAVFVFPKAEQLAMVATLADRHPDVTVVVDHMAFPDETTAPDESPWTDFEAVAERSNVAVKVSSLPRSAESAWPYPDLHGYVRRLVEWFGPERCMLGSDYPWMDDWAGYEESLSWVEECEFLSARDLSYLSGRAFESVHGV
jgi:L-fuconolactonase